MLTIDNQSAGISAEVGALYLSTTPDQGLNLNVGYVVIPKGGSQSPGLRFDADIDSGIFSPNENTVAICGNGSTIAMFSGPATWNDAGASLMFSPGVLGSGGSSVSPCGISPFSATPADVDLSLSGLGSGRVVLSGLKMPVMNGVAHGQMLAYDNQSNGLVWVDPPSGGGGGSSYPGIVATETPAVPADWDQGIAPVPGRTTLTAQETDGTPRSLSLTAENIAISAVQNTDTYSPSTVSIGGLETSVYGTSSLALSGPYIAIGGDKILVETNSVTIKTAELQNAYVPADYTPVGLNVAHADWVINHVASKIAQASSGGKVRYVAETYSPNATAAFGIPGNDQQQFYVAPSEVIHFTVEIKAVGAGTSFITNKPAYWGQSEYYVGKFELVVGNNGGALHILGDVSGAGAYTGYAAIALPPIGTPMQSAFEMVPTVSLFTAPGAADGGPGEAISFSVPDVGASGQMYWTAEVTVTKIV